MIISPSILQGTQTLYVITNLIFVNVNVPCRFYLQRHVVLKLPRALRHDGINGSEEIYMNFSVNFFFFLFSLVKGETNFKVFVILSKQ